MGEESTAEVINLDVKQLTEEVEREHREKLRAEAKRKLKDKIEELHKARLVVANLQRELEDLQAEIAQQA